MYNAHSSVTVLITVDNYKDKLDITPQVNHISPTVQCKSLRPPSDLSFLVML